VDVPQKTRDALRSFTVALPDLEDSASTRRWLAFVAGAFVTLQVSVCLLGQYGYFIDELYYVACARHPAFGYVDHPPLAPLVLAVTRHVFGESILGIRIVAFACGALVVWASGRMATDLGGGRWAVLTTAVTSGLSPGVLGLTGFYSVNAFEAAIWVLCTWAVVRLLRSGDPRWWLAIGLAIGLGFESKHTISTLAIALAGGVVLTSARRMLWSRWAMSGVIVALVLALPNSIWQAVNGFPSLEFYRQAALLKNLPAPPAKVVIDQLRIMGLFTSPAWAAGLAFAWFHERRYRPLVIAYAILLAMLVVSQQSRPDRLLGIYPMLIAAGMVAFERWIRPTALRAIVAAVLVVGCLPGIPIVIGVLPPPVLARYMRAIGIDTASERGRSSPIPQLLADRTGWEDFVAQVARIHASLPPDEARHALIYAPSYGQAGAIDLLGSSYGLPRAIASQNSYYHWSAREGVDSDVLIAVGANRADLESLFREVTEVGVTDCAYCMSWRNGMPIYLARGAVRPLSTMWSRVRHYE